MTRKKPLLRTEIEMLQIILEDKTFPTEEYRLKLVERLEELKKMWYKVKVRREPKLLGCGKYSKEQDRNCGNKYGYFNNEKRGYVGRKTCFDIWLCQDCEKRRICS